MTKVTVPIGVFRSSSNPMGDCLRHQAFAPAGSSLLRSLAGFRFNPYRKGGLQ